MSENYPSSYFKAMARYEFYAQKADVEGLTEAAQALRCLGRSAREQAFGHMEFLDESEDPEEDSSSTEVNVETCINQEQYVLTRKYWLARLPITVFPATVTYFLYTTIHFRPFFSRHRKEYEEFYPQWAETAYSENISDVGTWMESLRDTSFRNMTRLTRVQQHIEDIYKLEEDQEELESVPNGANTEKDPTLSR